GHCRLCRQRANIGVDSSHGRLLGCSIGLFVVRFVALVIGNVAGQKSLKKITKNNPKSCF
ncbi:MAG: hypothetical protein OIF58_11420, partial [Cohaesibacter sp.]|nr:hypothetical protein [Cohaesibacter sp.]